MIDQGHELKWKPVLRLLAVGNGEQFRCGPCSASAFPTIVAADQLVTRLRHLRRALLPLPASTAQRGEGRGEGRLLARRRPAQPCHRGTPEVCRALPACQAHGRDRPCNDVRGACGKILCCSRLTCSRPSPRPSPRDTRGEGEVRRFLCVLVARTHRSVCRALALSGSSGMRLVGVSPRVLSAPTFAFLGGKLESKCRRRRNTSNFVMLVQLLHLTIG